jgi:hypothetical protein
VDEPLRVGVGWSCCGDRAGGKDDDLAWCGKVSFGKAGLVNAGCARGAEPPCFRWLDGEGGDSDEGVWTGRSEAGRVEDLCPP